MCPFNSVLLIHCLCHQECFSHFPHKTYKATNQKVQEKRGFSAGCKYHISVIQTFVSSITHSQGLGKNYWDVTQYVGWSSKKLLPKRSESREDTAHTPAEAQSTKDRCAKGRAKNQAPTKKAVYTLWGGDPGFVRLLVFLFLSSFIYEIMRIFKTMVRNELPMSFHILCGLTCLVGNSTNVY